MRQDANHLITAVHDEALQQERKLLDALVELAAQVENGGTDHQNANVLRRHLEEPFLLVIVGEVKSGKSSFINALLEQQICAEGPTPLTDKIHVLRHGTSRRSELMEEFLMEHEVAVDLLRDIHIVDTPGTNSILREHSAITERFIPRSDLVLFLTSMDRPYSESENQFLAHISDRWRKKVVFLLSKIDGRDPADVQEVLDFVRRSCLTHHGFEPKVLPISARLAKEGLDGGLDDVRTFIRNTLSSGEKLALKLGSPLRSSRSVMESLQQTLDERAGTLASDQQAVQDLDRQVAQSASDLKERAHRYITELYDHFGSCEQRARAFFDSTVRLRNLAKARNSEKVREQFQREVIAELEEEFSATLNRGVDWLTRELISLHERATEAMHGKLQERDTARALPAEASRFEYRRDEVLRNILQEYDQHLTTLDVGAETRRLTDEMQGAMTRQLVVTATAVGVGAGSVALLTPLWAGAGVLGAVGLGLTSLAFLPAVRRRALRRFVEKAEELLRQIRSSFLKIFAGEIEGATQRLRRGWEPFLTFYRSESGAVEQHREQLRELRTGAAALEARLQDLGANGPS